MHLFCMDINQQNAKLILAIPQVNKHKAFSTLKFESPITG